MNFQMVIPNPSKWSNLSEKEIEGIFNYLGSDIPSMMAPYALISSNWVKFICGKNPIVDSSWKRIYLSKYVKDFESDLPWRMHLICANQQNAVKNIPGMALNKVMSYSQPIYSISGLRQKDSMSCTRSAIFMINISVLLYSALHIASELNLSSEGGLRERLGRQAFAIAHAAIAFLFLYFGSQVPIDQKAPTWSHIYKCIQLKKQLEQK